MLRTLKFQYHVFTSLQDSVNELLGKNNPKTVAQYKMDKCKLLRHVDTLIFLAMFKS